VRPSSLEECLAVLKQSGKEARILAGGTDLLVNMKYGVVRPKTLVSVGSLPELRSVSSDGQGSTRIGACANLSDLAANSLVSEKHPSLHQAVKSVASKHIRNMACLGGNVCLETRCWYYNQSKLWRDARELCHRTGGNVCHAIKGSDRCHALNSSDTVPALIALDAAVVVAKQGGERSIALKEFFRDDGARHTVLEPDEMVAAVTVPEQQPNARSSFMKVSMRRGLDFAMADCAASITANGRKPSSVTLVLNCIASKPLVLAKAAEVISESGLTEASIEEAADAARSELGTLTNLYTSAGYKRQLAGVLVKRVLKELGGKTKETRRKKR
jgi:4-hydroxybenzoyl-CoA reductase subunit beta